MNFKYFKAFIFVFAIELLLLFTKGFLRHTFGDYLVAILMYCFIKSFIQLSNSTVAILVLCIAFGIEFLQLTQLQETALFKSLPFIKTILGTNFDILDLFAYILGVGTITILDTHSTLFKVSE